MDPPGSRKVTIMAAEYSKNRLCKVLRVVTHRTKSGETIVDRHTDVRRGKDKTDGASKETAELRTLRYYATRLQGDLEMVDPRTVVSTNGTHRVYVTSMVEPHQCSACGAAITEAHPEHRPFCDLTKVTVTEEAEAFDPKSALGDLLSKSDE